MVCNKLPIQLVVCPCCNQGIKPSRSGGWIDSKFVLNAPCFGSDKNCGTCGMSDPKRLGDRLWNIWIGESFYPTPEDFVKESMQPGPDGRPMGVSRRVNSIPKGFTIGETWVSLSHRFCKTGTTAEGLPELNPGIFQVWRPSFIEYVVKGTETDEELDRLEKRGFTLIKVVEYGKQIDLF